MFLIGGVFDFGLGGGFNSVGFLIKSHGYTCPWVLLLRFAQSKWIYIYIYIFIYLFVFIFMFIYIYIYIYVCIYACIILHIYIYIYRYVGVYMYGL